MRGHTAFLISARKLAPGAVTPTPLRRKRQIDSPDRSSEIVGAAAQIPSHREQLELGPRCHQPLGRIEDVDDVRAVGGDDRDADTGPAVQFLVAGLRGGDVESAPQFGDHGSDHRPLLFERVHVTEQKVELQPADPHRGSARRCRGRRAGGRGLGRTHQRQQWSAVRCVSCHPLRIGLNSMGNANGFTVGSAALIVTLASTLPGWAAHARSDAVTLTGSKPLALSASPKFANTG